MKEEVNQHKSGYVDYAFSTLMNVPAPGDLREHHSALDLVSPAIGQLVVATPRGGHIDPCTNELVIPAIKLRNRTFIDELPLWQGTTSDLGRFYNEHTISAPTASVVAQDEILTAYHAVIPSAIARTYFIFGRHYKSAFAAARAGQTHIRVPAHSWIRVDEITACGKEGPFSGNDWARLKLSRPLPETIKPLARAPRDKVEALTTGELRNLRVVSHPLGLPLKLARADEAPYVPQPPFIPPYKILVDIGSGSSGAPLFRQECDGKPYELVGVVNGGKVNFSARHFVRTPSGIALDPAARFDISPQYVTPLTNICFPETAMYG